MQAARVVGAFAGGVLVLVTTLSILRTLVTPGGRAGRMSRTVDRASRYLFGAISAPISSFPTRHRVLSTQAPVILALMLWAWLAGYLIGYGLLLWPVVHNLARAVRESGSSLVTLGFAGTSGAGGTIIDILAGVTGLVVVALQIAYLPTLYAAFNRRETEVTMLRVRAGQPNWGPELLARQRTASSMEDLPEFYRSWERWASDVAESHASYPILLRFRSPDPRASWLLALLAVMDSAALWHSVSPEATSMQARLSLSMGINCLHQLATTVGIPYDDDPRPDGTIELTREEFDEGIARLKRVEFPMERSPDEAWRHFVGWRVNYESIAYRLARELDAVPAPWSGARKRPDQDLPPRRLVNRTPDDPEGLAPPPLQGPPKR
jgi:hypothetical protein